MHQRLGARQPVAHRGGLGQGQRHIVRDDPTRLGRVGWRQVVRAAGQLCAGRGFHHHRGRVSGRTARQQVRVSEIGQQGEPDPDRQGQRGEEIVPQQVIVVGHIVRLAEQQAGSRFFRRLASEEAVAADMDEDRAGSPPRHAPTGRLQKRSHQGAVQVAVEAEDSIRGEAAGQQRLRHGGLVAQHGGFARLGCGNEEGEAVGSQRLAQLQRFLAGLAQHNETIIVSASASESDKGVARQALGVLDIQVRSPHRHLVVANDDLE